MKRVTLKSLTLCNFKGEKERTTNFNPDVTTISGGNGLGKSRHFDAFIWLLFGKDSKDRKDYEIKTRIDGQELHNVECSVTGVIEVDGEEITLKRALMEDWVKPRGQVERVFKGNHTECWWNDTPVNVGEYAKRIEAIIASSVFKMITNPAFFVNMPWKLQREQLFQLAGTVTDAEIAAKKPEFAVLLDKISGKSLADFKAEISARKGRLKEELEQIQPRIDQTYKMMPENEDFNAIEVQIGMIDNEIRDIDRSIADMTATIRKMYEAEQEKQKKVNDLKSQCQKIIFKATEDAQKAAFEANSRRREIESTISSKEREIAFNRREIESGRKEIERLEAEIKKLKAEQDDLRGKWYEENGKVYNGETICPHCGQELPVAMVEQAREIFIKEQVCKCNDLNDKGMLLGTRIKDLEARIKEVQANIENVAVDSINAEIEKLKAEFCQLPVVDAAAVVPESIPEWVELQEQIKGIEATISTEKAVPDVTMTESEKKSELNERRDVLKKRLANRDAIKKYETEIERLEARGKELAQQIANAEKEEYTIEQFTRTKIDECETRINSMFKFVTFRLFDYTLENNAVETCIPLVNGVPYPSANTAGQINAGLDIINTLCKFYGICAPIFIDNRESVNDIIETESQVINLVVNKDNFLTIK